MTFGIDVPLVLSEEQRGIALETADFVKKRAHQEKIGTETRWWLDGDGIGRDEARNLLPGVLYLEHLVDVEHLDVGIPPVILEALPIATAKVAELPQLSLPPLVPRR